MARTRESTSAGPVPGPLLDRFGLVLLVVSAAIICHALIDVRTSYPAAAVTHALSGAALMIAVRAAGVTRRWRRAADVLVLLTLIANAGYGLLEVVGWASAPAVVGGGPELAWLLAAFFVPVVVARRLVYHSVVSVATVLGAVAAYLEIAVAYAYALQAVDAVSVDPLFGSPVSSTTYMYVSLMTITTLGYGDVVPTSDVGRLVAVSEAVVGQIFLVTFVALIVSRFANRPVGEG